jgi:hypothetical protein
MKKSGLADSPFFTVPAKPITPSLSQKIASPIQEGKDVNEKKLSEKKLPISKQLSNKALLQASNHASMQTGMQESLVELIRKAVKDVGKESATYRFTPEEKKALLELTFTYKVQGFKTSENELTRIAINFILEDHKQNGRNSVLEKVLQALNK